MKKRILSALTSLALTATCFAQAAAAPMLIASAADTSYEVGKVAANAGETVSVPVYVSGDTGTSGIVVSLEADDRLSYAGQADGNAYTGDVVWNSEDLYWVFSTGEGEEQTAADGAVMFTVDFKVPENAKAGDEFPISLNVDEVVDTNGTLLEVDTVAGMIYIPDGDGTVTYTVDTVEGEAGQNVTVPVYVTGDTGTSGIIVGLTAHEGLTLAGESDGNAYTGDTVWNEDDLYWVFATADGANQKAADDAVMFNVTFTVPDDAQPGDEFPIEFAVAEAVDTIGTPLNVTTVNGKIVIPDAIVTDPAGSVTYTVDTVEGEAGQDVTVPVYVTGDTGTSGIIIGLTADSRLTLKGESDGAAYTGDVVWNEDDLYWVFATEDGGNQKAADDAVMFNVTFTVPDDAQPGDEFPIEFAVAEAVDTFGTDMTVTTVNGKIVIPDAIVTDPAGSVTYTVDTVEGAAGADVTVPVYVTGDTGTSGIIIGLTADSRLTLKGESDGAAYTGDVVWNENDLYWVFATEDGGNQKAADDAVMFNVTFTVPDDAQPGDEFPIEFAVAEAVDTFGTDLTVTTVNGMIYIPDETTTTTEETTTTTTEETTTTTTEETTTEPEETTTTTTILPGSIIFEVDTVAGAAGATVEVPVYVIGEAGVSGIVIGLTADNRLTYADANNNGGAYTGDVVWNEKDLYWVFATTDGSDQTAASESVMFTISFTVPEDATVGDEFPIDFLIAEAVDTLGQELTVVTNNGMIYITEETTTTTEGTTTTTTTTETEPTTTTTTTTIVVEPGNVVYRVDTVAGAAGATVPVPVYVLGTADTAGIVIGLTADSRLTYADQANGDAYTGEVVWNADDLYWVFATEDGGNQTAANGATMFTVSFTVPEDATVGDEYPITFVVAEAIDTNGTPVGVTTIDGMIYITAETTTTPAETTTTESETTTTETETTTTESETTTTETETTTTESETTTTESETTTTTTTTESETTTTESETTTTTTIVVEPGTVVYKIDTVRGNAGETVQVPVHVLGDAGTAGIVIGMTADERVAYAGQTNGDAYTGDMVWNEEDFYWTFSTADGENQIAANDAVMFTVSFTIPEDAVTGDVYPVNFSEVEATDTNGNPLTVVTIDGSIIVVGETTTTPAETTTTEPAETTTTVVTSVSVSYAEPQKQCYWSHDPNEYVVDGMEVILYVYSATITDGEEADFTAVEPTVIDLTDKCVLEHYTPKDTYVPGTHKYYINVYLDEETCATYEALDPAQSVGTFYVYIGLKGDTNLNEVVDADDAVLNLKYYAESLLGREYQLNEDPELDGKDGLAFYVGDVDSNDSLDADDAVYILKYYAIVLIGQEPSWLDIIGFEIFPYDEAHQELN